MFGICFKMTQEGDEEEGKYIKQYWSLLMWDYYIIALYTIFYVLNFLSLKVKKKKGERKEN